MVKYMGGGAEVLLKAFRHIEHVLETEGYAQATFMGLSERRSFRTAVFRKFGGYSINLEWSKHALGWTAVLTVTAEMLRTSVGSVAAGKLNRVVSSVESEFGSDGLFRCPVCGEMLPKSSFARRNRVGGSGGRQSYCKQCNSLYQEWRYHFLKERHAERLVSEFTAGGRNSINKYFQEWYRNNK